MKNVSTKGKARERERENVLFVYARVSKVVVDMCDRERERHSKA